MSKPEPYTFFYDEDCGLCTRAANWLLRVSPTRIRVFPLGGREADRVLSGVSTHDRFRQAWGTDGRQLFAGHEAAWRALYTLPVGGILRVLRYIPGFHWVSPRVYQWIADHRSPTCRLKSHSAQ